jgi:hypothetical protein
MLVASLGVGLLACGTAAAQYASDFEALTGSPDGTVMTGQDAYYIPAGTTSVDYFVYTYAGNPFGFPDNPGGGGEQFVAGTGPADGTTFARAQRDIDWGSGVVAVTYDVAALWMDDPNDPNDATANNIGSLSVQPYTDPATSAGYLHLFSYVVEGEEPWQALYMMYDAVGTVDAQPGREPGPEWVNLELLTWYRFGTVVDFEINQVIEVSITNLHTGASATVDTSADGWYLGGGTVGLADPTGFRFFSGGNEASNTLAWDNISIGPAGVECVGDIDGDGDTDLSDLAALLASYNKCTGDPGFEPAADYDDSGCVDLSDLAFLLADYLCGT